MSPNINVTQSIKAKKIEFFSVPKKKKDFETPHEVVQSWCHFEALKCIFHFGKENFSLLSSADSKSRR